MPGLLERLRGPGISGAVAPIGASARNLLVRYLAFLQTIVLCLSVPIRGYDDPNFDIPSATLSLHLQSCEIVSASLWGLVRRADLGALPTAAEATQWRRALQHREQNDAEWPLDAAPGRYGCSPHRPA